jgi:quercetin dioxygenase-like cupin family protein
MITTNLHRLPLLVGWTESPDRPSRVAFPLFAAAGTERSAVVSFELDPGATIGEHTDSAEEIPLVLSGTVEATPGTERGQLQPGALAVIPQMVPHDVRNIGGDVARIVGFFADATVVSTFTKPIQPVGITQGDSRPPCTYPPLPCLTHCHPVRSAEPTCTGRSGVSHTTKCRGDSRPPRTYPPLPCLTHCHPVRSAEPTCTG